MSKLIGSNPFTRNVSGFMKTASAEATSASNSLSTGVKSNLGAVTGMISSSLSKQSVINKVVLQNMGQAQAQLQTMKDSLLKMQDTAMSMMQDIMTAKGKAESSTHRANIATLLHEKQVLFNSQLDDCTFNGKFLLTLCDFEENVRTSEQMGDELKLHVDELIFMNDGVEATEAAKAAVYHHAAKTHPYYRAVDPSATKPLVIGANWEGCKTVAVQSLGYAAGDRNVGEAMYNILTFVAERKDEYTAATGKPDSTYPKYVADTMKDAVFSVVRDTDGLDWFKKGALHPSKPYLNGDVFRKNVQTVIDKAGPTTVRQLINVAVAFAGHRYTQEDRAFNSTRDKEAVESVRVVLEAVGNVNRLKVDTDVNADKTFSIIKDEFLEKIRGRLSQVNSAMESLRGVSNALEQNINVTEETHDSLSKADIISEAQKFADALAKLKTTFGVISSGNALAQQIVQQTTSTMKSTAA